VLAEGKAPEAYRLRKLRDLTAALTSLAEYASSRRLIVVVMKGTWCPVCIGQLRRLADLEKELTKLGATVIGLSTDSVERCRKAAFDHQLPFAILSDPDREVVSALKLWRAEWGHPMPSLIVFDRCGIERGRIVGRSPDERAEPALLSLLRSIAHKPERCTGNA
jgi:peroxiredoxin Q/BCP